MAVKVLIVDDSSMLRNLLISLLPEEYDYDIDEAIDGAEAIRKFSNIDYRLMFLDLHMPNIDGFEVLKTIGNDTKDCCIIATSADIQDEAQKRVFEHGISSFIKKPYDYEDISNAVNSALKQ